MAHEPTSFSRTMRALDTDGMSPTALAVILVAGLGGVWTGWLVTARVPVYQTSEAARLEVERVHPIDAPVVGRVISTSLVLGREVKVGDVLLEIEAEREKLETSQEQARVTALTGEVDQLAARGVGRAAGDRRGAARRQSRARGGRPASRRHRSRRQTGAGQSRAHEPAGEARPGIGGGYRSRARRGNGPRRGRRCGPRRHRSVDRRTDSGRTRPARQARRPAPRTS